MRKLVNWGNYIDTSNPVNEVNTLPSKTVPGMTMSIRELVQRYIRGEDVTTFEPVYTDDPDLPDDLEYMTELERLDMAANIREGIKSYQEDKKKEAATKKDAPPAPAPKAPPPADPYPAPTAEPPTGGSK